MRLPASRSLFVALLGSTALLVAVLYPQRRAGATIPMKQQDLSRLLGSVSDNRVLAGPPPNVPSLRCYASSLYYADHDASGNISMLDSVVAWGPVRNGPVEVGEWHMATTVLSPDAATGLLQMTFKDGNVTIDIGYATAGGIRSGLPCRPVVGGTGRYTKISGNAGIWADNAGFYVVLNTK
jgi:hypothetical protein